CYYYRPDGKLNNLGESGLDLVNIPTVKKRYYNIYGDVIPVFSLHFKNVRQFGWESREAADQSAPRASEKLVRKGVVEVVYVDNILKEINIENFVEGEGK